MSRSASAAPRSPATVEKRTKRSVFLPTCGEELRPGVLGDVVGDGEGAEGAGALGVHPALGDDLAVEVGQLLQEPDVLQQHRTPRARRSRCPGCWGPAPRNWWSASSARHSCLSPFAHCSHTPWKRTSTPRPAQTAVCSGALMASRFRRRVRMRPHLGRRSGGADRVRVVAGWTGVAFTRLTSPSCSSSARVR